MQLFPRKLNLLPMALGAGGAVVPVFLVLGVWYYGSAEALQAGYQPVQPVQYSHRLHAGELGIDCRYCHANVERSAEAMVPPTQTCMGCHAQVKRDSALLAPVRESWQTDRPIPWVRVHMLPDHVFFDHSPHLAAGVGCVTCHGRIDRMEEVALDQPIAMGWCLDCHRDPEPSLRPHDQITHMDWEPPDEAWRLVEIGSVVRGSPAARAGLRAGDVIETVGGDEVGDFAAAMAAVQRHAGGDNQAVELVVRRRGQLLDPISVTPVEHENGGHHFATWTGIRPVDPPEYCSGCHR